MNTKLTIAVIALAWLTGANRTTAQGTAFAYQGQLQNNGNPASGTYNFTFSLYNAAGGGPVVAGPVSTNGVVVTNGLFQVSLDFGASVWNGQTNWLQISVATNGSPTITALTPLQQIAPVPQAIFATTASNLLGTLPAAQVSGTVPLAQLPAGVVINNASGVALTGTFNGNGTGLTSVNAAQLNGLNALNFWQLGGNTVSATQILGSTNNQPLAIVAGGQLAGLITAAAGGPEIIWGISNSITSGSPPGASILGGSNNTMSGTANYAVIAGGQNNSLGYSYDAVIGGGYSNRVGQASYDVVGGGIQNSIGTSSSWGFIGGGELNVIGANTPGAVVGGGDNNTNNGNYSFLGGGNLNTMGNSASYGSLGGGANNLVNGNYATVPGGNNNVASGKYGFAAGYNAQATNQGAFVWADSQSAPFASTNNDSFNVRARGGVHLVTSGGGLTVDATVTATNFIGNAAGLTNLPAAQLTGNIPVASLPADLVTNTESGVTLNNLNLGGTLTLPPPATIFSGPATAFYADDDNVYAGLGAGVISPAELDNTAMGAKAMGGATIDSGAVAIGYAALQADQAGTSVLLPNGQTIINPGQNTAIGFKSLQANTIGTSNTAVGYNTLNSNVNGARNTAVGAGALNINTSSDNTAVGAQALAANTTGTQNTALGVNALAADNVDSFNTAVGFQALQFNNAGAGNTAIGWEALNQNLSGSDNTAGGWGALASNTSGHDNTANGAGALQADTSGFYNTACGSGALTSSSGGIANVAVGVDSFQILQSGNQNTAVGAFAFQNLTSGTANIGLGYNAGKNLTSGNNNIYIGNEYTVTNFFSGDNNIYIGFARNTSESGMIYIGDPNVQTATYLAGTAYVQVLAITSDRNAKENFAAINGREVLAKVSALPVTEWNYKTDRKDQQHIGPMAQDFQAAFGLNGKDDKHISMADEGGVALAAIQGLNQKLEEENAQLKQQNDALAKRLSDLEQAVQALAERK